MKQAWHADNFKIVLRKVVCRHLGFSNGNFVSSTDEALNMKIRHIKIMFRLKQLDAPSTKVSSSHLRVHVLVYESKNSTNCTRKVWHDASAHAEIPRDDVDCCELADDGR